MIAGDVSRLPPGARLIHIGHPKSGSTALQVALVRERNRLGDHGVVYPGVDQRSAEAGWAALGIGAPVGRPAPRIEKWHELMSEVAAADEQLVCISNEDFARATPESARTVVEGLGGDRAHVVLVVRRLDRLLPSQWQERIKALQTIPFDAWLHEALGDPESDFGRRNPWISDLGSLIDRWSDVVGPDRFTLIIGDEANHALVPRTFEQLLGLPAGMLETDPSRSNRSLSLDETELVRAVNVAFRDLDLPRDLYHQLVQRGLVRRLMEQPRGPDDLPIPALPTWAADRVGELSVQRAELVRAKAMQVVGDPDGLLAPSASTAADQPLPTTVSLELATRAVTGVLEAVVQRERRAARARRGRRSTTPGAGQHPAAVEEKGSVLGKLRRRVTRSR